MTALAELHLHLDGSLRMSTLRELAARAGKPVPADLLFRPGMGLAEALARSPSPCRSCKTLPRCGESQPRSVRTRHRMESPHSRFGSRRRSSTLRSRESQAGRGSSCVGFMAKSQECSSSTSSWRELAPESWRSISLAGRHQLSRFGCPTTRLPSPARRIWESGEPCTPVKADHLPRSGSRSSSCTRSASVTAPRCWKTRLH